ncbi:MAG: response regulator [Thermoanaerobaculaceae bacterium]|nr:response regulator [Thermoanaerobaculaceae bacterium]TAM54186.1 MAG: response regulator [Acidobacteriota bacterium]
MSDRAAPRSGPAKILIVDDERDIVEYLSMALEDAGFKAAGLAGTQGALEWIAAERPDLVLLDVMMPGHTGLSLYRAMREGEATKRIPVVIISGYARKEDVAKMGLGELESGGLPPPDGYLEKPITVPTLLATLRRLLERDEIRSGKE